MIIKEIKEDENSIRHILISGISDMRIDYKSIEKQIEKICKVENVIIQFFNAKLIADWEHIYFSVVHALKSFKQGRNLSNNLDLEILLFASGQRQIKVAINEFGIGSETSEVVLLIIGYSKDSIREIFLKILKILNKKEDEAILKIDENKYSNLLNYFKISPIEIETIANSNNWEDKLSALIKLILNRIAFVVFEK
ncbi:MAG: KEOPS complex subunit Cgi121 [Candidatus Helarchaeota archaeon]